MSTTDFSQMSADEIRVLLEQRRAEINSLSKVAKEKGVTVPSEPKFPKTVSALRQVTRSWSKAERNFNEAQAIRDEARAKRDQAMEAHLQATGASEPDQELTTMLQEVYDQAQQRLPGVKKSASDEAETSDNGAEQELAAAS